MLEKNKDYVEFTLQCTSVEYGKNKKDKDVCFNGYSDFDFPGVPMDVVCKEFDHKVVMVSKRAFERLQTRADSNAELARQWEINYDLLFKKTGFDTVEELVFYLTNVVQCDTLQEAIASLQDKLQYTRDEWKDMRKKLEECEKDYIYERDKAEALEKENKELKNKLHEFDPIPEFKELTEKLHSIEDVEELEWVLNHTCGGWGSINGWIPIARFWKKRYDDLLKLTGYKSERDIHAVLTLQEQFVYETMRELINSLKRKAKFTDSNWQNATGCNSPVEAETTMRNLRSRIDEIKEFAAIASNWTDRIVEV